MIRRREQGLAVTSPLTNLPLAHTNLLPNMALRGQISAFFNEHPDAARAAPPAAVAAPASPALNNDAAQNIEEDGATTTAVSGQEVRHMRAKRFAADASEDQH